jgi:hypothetical protein
MAVRLEPALMALDRERPHQVRAASGVRDGVRRLISFSIPAPSVNYGIVPPVCLTWSLATALQRARADRCYHPLEDSLLYELGASAGSGWGMGGSWRVLPYLRRQAPHEPARVAKEMERAHPNPVPEGTTSAAPDAVADPWRDGYAAAFRR